MLLNTADSTVAVVMLCEKEHSIGANPIVQILNYGLKNLDINKGGIYFAKLHIVQGKH